MDDNKKAILGKMVWNYKDVCVYCGCSSSKAYRLIHRAIKDFDGKVPLGIGYAKTDSVLALFGTDRAKEMKTYGLL